jgi:multiple sugar transport system substrate-binding protein
MSLRRHRHILLFVYVFVIFSVSMAVEAKRELNVWIAEYNPTLLSILEEQILPPFEQLHQVDVTVQIVGWGELETKLKVATASGTPPDIFEWGNGAWEFAEAGLLTDLSARYQTWAQATDFFPPLLEPMTVKGRIYAVPLTFDVRTIFYLSDVWEESGLDPNSPPRTWSELREYTRRLTKVQDRMVQREGYALGRLLTGGGTTMQDYLPYLWQAGGEVLDPATLEPRFQEEPGLKAVRLLKDLRDFSQPGDAGPLARRDFWADFSSGQYGMYLAGVWVAAQIEQHSPHLAETVRAIIPPTQDVKPVAIVFINWLALHPHSKYPDLTWRLLQHLATPENLTLINEALGAPPPLRSAAVNTRFLARHPLYRYYLEAVAYARGVYALPKQTLTSQNVVGNWVRKALVGEMAPEIALEQAVWEWRALLDLN